MNLLQLSGYRLASEAEESTGSFNIERERVYYCMLRAASLLSTAVKSEYHEQYQVRLEGESKARVRVRKTIESDQIVTYVLTVKVDQDGQGGATLAQQTAVEVSADMFKMLLQVSGGMGMRKKRYFFRFEGLPQLLEVDVFVDAQGNPTSSWVKVDYETEGSEVPNDSAMHLLFSQILDAGSASEEDKQTIDKLYKEVFITDLRS